MATSRRCPVCRGSLVSVAGDAAPTRRYCCAACRQQAHRQRATTPAQERATADAQRAAADQAGADVARIVTELVHQLGDVSEAVNRRASRLTHRIEHLAELVDDLRHAGVAYDRAGGATWADLADAAGVDESTLRRRHRTHPPG